MRILTWCLAAAGRMDEARELAAEILRQQPDFTVHGYIEVMPYRSEWHRARVAELLRAVGLPEG